MGLNGILKTNKGIVRNITDNFTFIFTGKNIFKRTARDYLKAYEIIKKEDKTGGLILVKDYLLGHALELSLKSFIFEKLLEHPGKIIKEFIKNEFGHDLVKLASACDNKGYNFTKKDKQSIVEFNKIYKTKETEYYSDCGLRRVSFEELEEVTNKILKVKTK